MSNSWLCTRSKLLQICQIRGLTSSTWFQNRSNTLSVDLGGNVGNLQEGGCLLNTDLNHPSATPDHPFLNWNDRNSLLNTIGGSYEKPASLNTMSKYDIFAYLRPLCARNQDLIKSLAKIVEPVECNETIYVGKSVNSCKQNTQSLKTCSRSDIHAFNSFDLFSAVDLPVSKDSDNCLHMSASNASVKTQEKDWRSNCNESTTKGNDPDDERKGPTIAQLEAVKDYYIEIIPGFHKKGENIAVGLHHRDMVFENHLFKKMKVTVGVQKYVSEISKLRTLATLFYPSYHLEIQSILSHPNEGYVKMHWRAYVLSNFNFLKRFFSLFRDVRTGKFDNHDTIDAISTFHLNKDGQIVLHRVDRKITIDDLQTSTVSNLAAKTVEMVGLAPKSNCKDISKETL